MKTNGFLNDQQAPSMDGVPSATIAGSTPKEKLRNISNKAMIFHWHIDMVTKYMTNMLEDSDNDTQILLGLLSDSRDRLKKLSGRVEVLLQILDPNTPTTTSTKLQDVLCDDYEKKLYGWAVLNGHKEFLAMVLQEVAGFKDNTVWGLYKVVVCQPRVILGYLFQNNQVFHVTEQSGQRPTANNINVKEKSLIAAQYIFYIYFLMYFLLLFLKQSRTRSWNSLESNSLVCSYSYHILNSYLSYSVHSL